MRSHLDMALALAVLTTGFILLVFSAGGFIEGDATPASNLGLPPLSIGMLRTDSGTQAPEMQRTAITACRNSPSLPPELADEYSG